MSPLQRRQDHAGRMRYRAACGAASSSPRARRRGRRARRLAVTPLDRDLAVCSVGSENPTARPYYGPPIDTSNADRCDFMDPALCLQPWPNDYFTRADPSTDTGRRLNLNVNSTPANANGTHIDPTDFNRADGFSPGNLITVKIPQVETQAAFNNTGFVSINDLHRYSDPNQPVVVIDAATGRAPADLGRARREPEPLLAGRHAGRQPDHQAGPELRRGHRYIVALRNLRDAQNNPVAPPMPFRVYRDRLITLRRRDREPPPANGGPDLDAATNGIPRSNLYMTWDFTVASEHSLARRALAIRDDALSQLGDNTPGDGMIDGSPPTFQVTSVENNPAEPAGEHAAASRRRADQRPLLPEQWRLQPGRHLQLPPQWKRRPDVDRDCRRSGRGDDRRPVPLPDPELGRRRAARCIRPRAASSGTACWAITRKSTT